MKRSGRFIGAAVSVVAVCTLAGVLLGQGAEARKVLNPGAFTISPTGGSLSLRNTAFDLTPRPQPQCSDGIDNDGDGRIDLADTFCSANGAPAGTTAAADDAENAPNFQARTTTAISGTIDAQGVITIPSTGIVFPNGYIPFYNSANAFQGYVTVKVLPVGTSTGNLNPLTGVANLLVKAKIQITGTVYGVYTGANCTIGTTAAPLSLNLTTGTSGALAGTLYNASTGTARIVDNTFAVPAATGCAVGLVNLNTLVNQQLALPSPAGANRTIIEGATTPVLAKGLVAKITTTPVLLSGKAPFAVTFSASSSTAKAPATYRWTFPDGTSATGLTASKTFTTAGTQTVTLKVTDADGDTATVVKNVVVTAP